MKQVKCATKAFIMDDGKLLVIKQTKGNDEWWDVPGGCMEFGLTPEENLKKEIMEEVGIDVEIKKLIGTSQFIHTHDEPETKYDHVVFLNYLCEPKSKNIDITKNPDENENITKFEWLTPEEFFKALPNDNQHAGLKKFVKDYFLKE
jgi:ADP-ribose pyrophosphatase YjhB (NUDIX family)